MFSPIVRGPGCGGKYLTLSPLSRASFAGAHDIGWRPALADKAEWQLVNIEVECDNEGHRVESELPVLPAGSRRCRPLLGRRNPFPAHDADARESM